MKRGGLRCTQGVESLEEAVTVSNERKKITEISLKGHIDQVNQT